MASPGPNELKLMKDTLYLALTVELWSSYFEDFGENWLCYKGLVLYMVVIRKIKAIWQIYQIPRAASRLAPSQWEMSLQSNAASHWLGANLELALNTVYRQKKRLLMLCFSPARPCLLVPVCTHELGPALQSGTCSHAAEVLDQVRKVLESNMVS